MKLSEKQRSRVVLILILVVGATIIYSIVESILDAVYLNKDSRYTITTKISLGSRGHDKYIFYVNGKPYQGFSGLVRRDGRRYFIKYYPKNPNRSQTTGIVADSTDVKNLPADGYKMLPHH